MTLLGIVNLTLFSLILYSSFDTPAFSGPTGNRAIAFVVGIYVVGFVLYFVSRAVRRQRGVDLDLLYKEIRPSSVKLFYATDVHGSDRCFTKFVNAASFYGADAILLGGDLTGKAVVPLVRENGVHHGVFLGEDVTAEGEALSELEKKIANAGYYAFRCDRDEDEALRADPAAREALFLRLMKERLERWVALAEERLRPSRFPAS